jgi:hypothetical protein
MQRLIIIAHTAGADAHASAIAAELAALGYRVDHEVAARNPGARRALNYSIAAAHRYVVLWSRDAARLPALRAAAKRAHRVGKLAGIRLDTTAAPIGAGDAIILPRGRAQAHAWRRLLEQDPMSDLQANARQPTSRLTGFVAVLLLGLVTAGAIYATNTAFAAQVDGAITKAQAMVSSLAN